MVVRLRFHYRTCCCVRSGHLLVLSLLLLGSLLTPLGAQQTNAQKPATNVALTPQQQAELDNLTHQAGEAYKQGHLDRAAELWEAALAGARTTHNAGAIAVLLNDLGVVYNDLGQYPRALDYDQQALELRKARGSSQEIARSLNNLGNVYQHLGQSDKALESLQQALDIYKKLGNSADIATSLNNLGNLYNSMMQYDKALDYHQQALELRKQLGNPQEIGRSLHTLGNVYFNLGQYDKALDDYQQGLGQFKQRGYPQEIGASFNDLGNVYYGLGQYDRALDYYQQALELRKELGNAQEDAATLNNLGNVFYSLGRYDQALEDYGQALNLRQETGNLPEIAVSLHNLGTVYDGMGEYDSALSFCVQELELRQKVGKPQEIAASLNNLGNVYYNLGQYDRALEFHQQALELRQRAGKPQEIAASLNNLAAVYAHIGQYDRALECYRQALEQRKAAGNPDDIAAGLSNLGATYRQLNEYDRALASHQQALELRKRAGEPQEIAASLNDLGHVYYDMGQYDRALEYYQQALELRKKTGNVQDIAGSLENLGETYRHLHRLPEAEAAFTDCYERLESLIYPVPVSGRLASLQDVSATFYAGYACLLLEQQHPQDALEQLEAGRIEGLERLIDLNERDDITHLLTADERSTFDQRTDAVKSALVTWHRSRQRADQAPQAARASLTEQARAAQKAVQVAQQAYDLFRASLEARYPQIKEIAANPPADYTDLQAMAKAHPDTLYLEYGIVDDTTTLLFALGDRDGLKSFTLPTGRRALTELSRQWRRELERAGGRPVAASNPPLDARKVPVSEEALAKRAYQLLLGDLEKAGLLTPGRYKRLVVCGSGPLLEMPLAALCDGAGRRLIERYPLSHTPALSLLLRHAAPIAPKASLLCIADPTGEPQAVAAPPVAPPTAAGGGLTTVPDAAGRAHRQFRAGFAPLPEAKEEGRAVAGLFTGAKLLAGPEARREDVLKLLPDYGLLHFATHDFVVPWSALNSGLVLAREPDGSPEDGLLSARTILGLPLSARLAVLSGSETGQEQLEGGEGLTVLAWAFQAAGCPALVASQWEVNAETTRAWMVRFYGELKSGRSKDKALQAAMLAVKRDHAAPYYWSAFELIGDTSVLPK